MSGRVLVALTGASGAIYGVRCVQRLCALGHGVDVVLSDAARKVLAIEHRMSSDPAGWVPAEHADRITAHGADDITAPPASGSRAPRAMLVVPCSMATAARIAAGFGDGLIGRAADVMIKERRPLVIVPRETPLSAIHLRNLLTLAEAGVRVVPAMPAFYTQPESLDDMIDFVVDRALDGADLGVSLRSVWRAPGEGDPG